MGKTKIAQLANARNKINLMGKLGSFKGKNTENKKMAKGIRVFLSYIR